MNTEDAILHLKKLGYTIKEPREPKRLPNGCWRIEYLLHGKREVRFIEGTADEEDGIRTVFEGLGREIVEIAFSKDQFFFSDFEE